VGWASDFGMAICPTGATGATGATGGTSEMIDISNAGIAVSKTWPSPAWMALQVSWVWSSDLCIPRYDMSWMISPVQLEESNT